MTATAAAAEGWPVIELRQYTLRPGQRDVLVDLFERELVEPQERCGMRVDGQFRDLDRSDRFVWLRSFPSMELRRGALTAFYDGPVWRRHRDRANATMLDSDDVLLLRPSAPGRGLADGRSRRGSDGSSYGGPALFAATVLSLDVAPSPEVRQSFGSLFDAAVHAAGGATVAVLDTLEEENSFPRLPVREGEHVLVGLVRFPDLADHVAHLRRLTSSRSWQQLLARLQDLLRGPATLLALQPASGSRLR